MNTTNNETISDDTEEVSVTIDLTELDEDTLPKVEVKDIDPETNTLVLSMDKKAQSFFIQLGFDQVIREGLKGLKKV